MQNIGKLKSILLFISSAFLCTCLLVHLHRNESQRHKAFHFHWIQLTSIMHAKLERERLLKKRKFYGSVIYWNRISIKSGNFWVFARRGLCVSAIPTLTSYWNSSVSILWFVETVELLHYWKYRDVSLTSVKEWVPWKRYAHIYCPQENVPMHLNLL